MKLKKIASLALAGVMAVSMLAGCGTDKKPVPNPGEGEGTTTGYSSTFAGYVSEGTAKKDYITYADSTDDAAALKDALGNLGSVGTAIATVVNGYANPIYMDVLYDTTGDRSVDAVVTDFADALDLKNPKLRLEGAVDNLVEYPAAIGQDETVKYGMLYVVDGTVDVKKAVKQVAKDVDTQLLQNLPNANEETAVHYTYDYTVSVSVVNKPLTTLTNYTGSANFIAVTVTRVPTAA